ncbi:hypothetical protein NDU88_000073 [Pleurodeles waltl]|uniref:Uncharacterized protein n=1 Tax=Pleurodeles waltl TaxID=8319 RepID=A0AAV7MHR1_PLEWA|nr:hypothetical protein NDU88_000073 [Pleurodeles waltl]
MQLVLLGRHLLAWTGIAAQEVKRRLVRASSDRRYGVAIRSAAGAAAPGPTGGRGQALPRCQVRADEQK